MTTLAARLGDYLAHRMPEAAEIRVMDVVRIHGGASRETYRFRAAWMQSGESFEQRLILRRDPPASLIETDRNVEFAAYRAFHPLGLPVPRALFLENDSEWLDRPFFVMEQVVGCTAASPFHPDPYGAHAQRLGEQFWTHLGRLAAADPEKIGLTEVLAPVAAEDCWRRELDRWEAVIDEDELAPQPVARAAIRWLRRHPPPPPERVTVVHGDYRTGNFLFDESGTLRAILDWEMCHLGDPLEDVAWAADPLWAFQRPERPSGLIAREQAFACWERASGLRLDPERYRWWEMFASLKGLAIWISAGKEYQSGTNRDPVLALSSWYCADVHNRVLAARLAPLAREGRA